jgi:hypothetical protein
VGKRQRRDGEQKQDDDLALGAIHRAARYVRKGWLIGIHQAIVYHAGGRSQEVSAAVGCKFFDGAGKVA